MNKDDLILIIIIPSPFYRLYRFAKWALSIPLMIAKPFLTVILIPITHFHRTFSFWLDRLTNRGIHEFLADRTVLSPILSKDTFPRNGSETLLIILAMGSGETTLRTIHTTVRKFGRSLPLRSKEPSDLCGRSFPSSFNAFLKSLLVPSNNS